MDILSAMILPRLCRRLSLDWSTFSYSGTNNRMNSPLNSIGLTRSSLSVSVSFGGWIVPEDTGRIPPGLLGGGWKWLDTITPSNGSAGCDGHHPTTSERCPFWFRMFHIALVLRDNSVIGRTPEPSGNGSLKPWMPCL